jgi:hypothetical protein
MMKRLAVLALGLAVTTLAGAQLYKYVDKNGKTVYSDQPPTTGDSKQIRVQSGGGPSDAPAPKAAAGAEKDKGKKEDPKAVAKKSDDAAKEAERKKAACDQARVRYQALTDGGRIYKYNAAGEREYMSDEEIESGARQAKREMDEACKAS